LAQGPTGLAARDRGILQQIQLFRPKFRPARDAAGPETRAGTRKGSGL